MTAGEARTSAAGRQSTALGVGASAYLLLLAAGSRLLRDPDTHWHVAVGDWMLAHGRVPTHDAFSHSMPGAPWTAHEWLAEIVFALAHRVGGSALVVAVTAAAAALAAFALARHLDRRLAARHVVVLVALGAMLVAAHLHARPHVLVLPCLVLFATALADARADGRAPHAAWALLVALWANLHGSFPLAAALAAAFGLEAVLAATPGGARRTTLRAWAAFCITVAAAGFLTPHGGAGYAYAVGFADDTRATALLDEWRPVDFTAPGPLTLWLFVFGVGGLLLRPRVAPIRLVLLLALVALAVRHARHGELLGLLAPVLLAPSLAGVLPGTRPTPRPLARLDAPRIAGVVAVLAAATAGIAILRPTRSASATTPDRALAAVAAAGIEGPVLNAYGFGGYLVARGIPTFIDTRTDLYGSVFFDRYAHAVLEGDPRTLEGLLDRYRITWTLLQPGMPAIATLHRMPGIEQLYADDVAVVHVRTVRP